ncbi:MAG: hypothetical protein NVSMB42_25810 [Herpetosiphon sp.]
MQRLGIQGVRYAALGNPNAPVTIVEFADYGCPFCRVFHATTFRTLNERYIKTGSVYYVYKDFPVVSKQGGLAGQAAACAGEQGQYWAMHDQLFTEPSTWDTTPSGALATFGREAGAIGLDAGRLTTCITTGRWQGIVERGFAEGTALHLTGTPSFFVNGQLLAGAQGIDAFTRIIDHELGKR